MCMIKVLNKYLQTKKTEKYVTMYGVCRFRKALSPETGTAIQLKSIFSLSKGMLLVSQASKGSLAHRAAMMQSHYKQQQLPMHLP